MLSPPRKDPTQRGRDIHTPANLPLPAILEEIAEVAGLSAAIAIAIKRGGTKTYIPGHARNGNWLPELVGRVAADKICDHFRTRQGGVTIRLPLGPRSHYHDARVRAEEMIRAGMSSRAVADELGIHQRSVERYRARSRDIAKRAKSKA